MYEHIVVETRYISWLVGITKISNTKSDRHAPSVAIMPFDMSYMISY